MQSNNYVTSVIEDVFGYVKFQHNTATMEYFINKNIFDLWYIFVQRTRFFGDVDYDFWHTLCMYTEKKFFISLFFLDNQDALLNFLSKTTIYLLFKYKIENLEVGRDFLGEHNFVSKNNSMFQL